jgi:hypothetical protein
MHFFKTRKAVANDYGANRRNKFSEHKKRTLYVKNFMIMSHII